MRTFMLMVLGAAGFLHAYPQGGASLNEAAAFYHQGRFDSALVRLQALKSQGPWKRRDSLSLVQYLGMSSARLGRETEAVGYFTELLALDSLFQFPRNEDPSILDAFRLAGEMKTRPPRAPPETPASTPTAPPSAPALAPQAFPAPEREKISLVDSGGGASSGPPAPGNIGLTMGAMPLGTGWLVRHKVKHGLALGLMQAGGLAVSLYASGMISREEGDAFQVMDRRELADIRQWQWVQRISLSTALGAYLFSLIASAGD